MSENPYLALIAGLNSDSPANASTSSPEDFSAELSLWTNAEFTFDMPPGLGIFESDSGFADLAASNTVGNLNGFSNHSDPMFGRASTDDHNLQQPDHSLNFLNLSAPQEQDSRPLSLLERSRQRNPVNEDQVESKSELQEPIAEINSFHSLLAAYSAATQQLQLPGSNTSTLQPDIAPASPTAPTTPAAAKLLRQPMPQYSAPATKKQKTLHVAVVPPADAAAASSSPITDPLSLTTEDVVNNDIDDNADKEHEDQQGSELSAADSFSRDDPEYLTKVVMEEDKRRRNTAASARFRQKKKLRELALENTAREQTVRAETLENRVKELEMEVRWLRGLIVEKDSRLHEATVNLHDAAKRLQVETH
ncbi:hypothetical protein BG011_008873 [Mortierella polycephala]|uniref:BZIP domain-containing protein n=1 Tax=Mortierella polycephala TaxID=41804 RepID=A0A9P6PP25_9FUNG|nr:hypothetical protein BG011_008873 [Mortierella polycephala]